jgi:dihydrofolate synthase / folylpolyglutamate synthase
MNEMEAYVELDAMLDELIPPFKFSGDINLRLERIEMLVDLLDHPERKYPVVHVGGTSGKGSVTAMTAAIAFAHGRHVGLHLSPYVEVLTETWQIDGQYAKPGQMLAIGKKVLEASAPIADALPMFGRPSFFEIKVAMAFQLFADAGVDLGVVEVGMGGARDGTNVLGPGVQVLTNVGLDHTERLGKTVEKIAADKVGIFKPDSEIVSGVEQRTVKDIARAKAAAVGSLIRFIDDEVTYETGRPGHLAIRGLSEPIDIEVPAEWLPFQVRNAVLAVSAGWLSLGSLEPDRVGTALRAVRLPARLERFEDRDRTVLLDGAHNVEKIRTTANYLATRRSGGRCIGVVALKKDKDANAVLRQLQDVLDAVVFTTFEADLFEPTSPEDLAATMTEAGFRGPVMCESDPQRAFQVALDASDAGDWLVVTGSLYLAGNLRSRWFPVDDEIRNGASFRL